MQKKYLMYKFQFIMQSNYSNAIKIYIYSLLYSNNMVQCSRYAGNMPDISRRVFNETISYIYTW